MSKHLVPMIHVPNVHATVEWYESIGFRAVATYGNETEDGLSFAIMSFGNGQVMFNQGGETSDRRRREVDLYVYTDDVDALFSRLKDRVEVVEGPHNTFYGMREIIIRDLNRFWITFAQESVFGMLLSGISESKPDLVRSAIASGQLQPETINVAFAAALVKQNAEIVELLRHAGAKPPPEVPLETLQSYAGRYKGTPGPEVEMTLEEGRLFVTPAGQQQMSLWPLDQTTFKPIAFEGATIKFNVEAGQTVGLTFTQDGLSMELLRL